MIRVRTCLYSKPNLSAKSSIMFRSIVKIQHGKKLQQQITLTFQIDIFQILFEKKKTPSQSPRVS